MLEYNDHVIVRGPMDGKNSVTANITLPCFSGDDVDLQTAARLNGFYTYAAGVLYSYAASMSDPEARQISYTCQSEVALDAEHDTVEVTLHILERRTYRGRRSEVLRKTLSHTFRNGYAVSRRTAIG